MTGSSKGRRSKVEPTSDAARNRMRAGKPRDTKPELALRDELDRRGIVYATDRLVLPGYRRRADIVLEAARVVVYVDGCFWHGCPTHGTWPKQNAEFWRDKIETNRKRDADTDRLLSEMGWTVVRVWEHEDPSAIAAHIAELGNRLPT